YCRRRRRGRLPDVENERPQPKGGRDRHQGGFGWDSRPTPRVPGEAIGVRRVIAAHPRSLAGRRRVILKRTISTRRPAATTTSCSATASPTLTRPSSTRRSKLWTKTSSPALMPGPLLVRSFSVRRRSMLSRDPAATLSPRRRHQGIDLTLVQGVRVLHHG